MVNTICTADLEILGACETQVEGFRRTFPDAEAGVEVTVDNVLVAIKAELDLRWLALATFLTPAHVEYKRVVTAAEEEFLRSTTPTREELYRACGLRITWSDPTPDAARAAHKRALSQGRATYNRAVATAWVEAYEASAEAAGKGAE